MNASQNDLWAQRLFLFTYYIFPYFSQFICDKLESTEEKIIVFAHHLTMLDQIEEDTVGTFKQYFNRLST